MIRHRWWVVVALSLLGVIAALVLTDMLSDRVRPQFEASAVVPFAVVDNKNPNARSASDSSASGDEETLDEALARAIEANATAVEDGTGRITGDPRAGELRFTARGREEAAAVAAAEAMRFEYLRATTQEAVESRTNRLAEIVAEAGGILAQIQDAQPAEPIAAPTVPAEVQAQLDLLVSLEGALQQQVTNLEVNLVLAGAGDDRSGTPDEIQAELDLVSARLDEVSTELVGLSAQYGITASRTGQGALPDASSGSSNPRTGSSATDTEATPETLEDVWTLEALQSRYDTLSSEYETLFLDPGLPEVPVLTEPVVQDLTPNVGTPLVNSLLGLLGGILLALGLVVAESTLRGRVRDESDIYPIPVFAEFPAMSAIRRASGNRERTLVGRRTSGVKQLRNVIVPVLQSAEMEAVGITGISVSPAEVQAIAIDLAQRLGASDRRVVVLGLGFDDEWSVGMTESDSVASLWADIRRDAGAGIQRVTEVLSADSRVGGVQVLAPGYLTDDPTDVAHTEAFASLLKACRANADIVLAVTADATNPATQALLHGLDGILAVCAVHGTSRKRVQGFLAAATPSGARMLGAVLLSGQSGISMRDPAPAQPIDPVSPPIDELRVARDQPSVPPVASLQPPADAPPPATATPGSKNLTNGRKTEKKAVAKTGPAPSPVEQPSPAAEPREGLQEAAEPAPPAPAAIAPAPALVVPGSTVAREMGTPRVSRVQQVLDRVERALEPYIDPPGGPMVPIVERGAVITNQNAFASGTGKGSRRSRSDNQPLRETEF